MSLVNLRNDGQRESPPRPDLFPEDAGQAESAAIVATQNEQANEHNQKQDQVGKHRRDIIDYAGPGADRDTGVLYRVPNSAKLPMR